MTDHVKHVDNTRPVARPDGTSANPFRTADDAFRDLPSSWNGRAEIIFAPSTTPYEITTRQVSFGAPYGPDATPLVIRAGDTRYRQLFRFQAQGAAEHNISTNSPILTVDQLMGAVLKRESRLSDAGAAAGTAISIRSNTAGRNAAVTLQGSMGAFAWHELFSVEGPAVTLRPTATLTLTSQDGHSLNLTLQGIKIEPAPGASLILLNLRAQCDTCDFSFTRDPMLPANRPWIACDVHSSSRIQGGLENADLSPDLVFIPGYNWREQAGVFIHTNTPVDSRGNRPVDLIWARREGVLGGHLTLKNILTRISQGGMFIPKSLEACGAPIHILAGGAAIAGETGWGTESNKARIRDVVHPTGEGDGLRLSNGAWLHSPLAPINLDVSNCSRDGIRLDIGALASFGPPGGPAGLSSERRNGRFGMNIRNGSQAFIGSDAFAPFQLLGREDSPPCALDDEELMSWDVVLFRRPQPNRRLSLVAQNI